MSGDGKVHMTYRVSELIKRLRLSLFILSNLALLSAVCLHILREKYTPNNPKANSIFCGHDIFTLTLIFVLFCMFIDTTKVSWNCFMSEQQVLLGLWALRSTNFASTDYISNKRLNLTSVSACFSQLWQRECRFIEFFCFHSSKLP